VSENWVRDHGTGRRRPALACVKLGRTIRFRMSDVEQFVEECTRQAKEQRK